MEGDKLAVQETAGLTSLYFTSAGGAIEFYRAGKTPSRKSESKSFEEQGLRYLGLIAAS
jgi:hypothetical protein